MKSIFFAFLTIFAVSFASAQMSNNVRQIPFSFKTLDGKTFTNANLKANKSTIVIFFDPYCEHCESQASWFAAAASKFASTQFLFVTTEPTIQASVDFKQKYFAGKNMDVTFLLDTNFKFDGYFGYSETPSIYVYNKAGNRTQALKKETPVDKIIPYL